MKMGRWGIGLKSTPQSFCPLLSRNSENGFLLWGKNTLFQFPPVFLPRDSQLPSILTSWDLDKCVEKIIRSYHILTNRSCTQRCLERADRKWPSKTVLWPLSVWLARAPVSCILWLWHFMKMMNLMNLRLIAFITAGDEIQSSHLKQMLLSVTRSIASQARVSKARKATVNSSSAPRRVGSSFQLWTWAEKKLGLIA